VANFAAYTFAPAILVTPLGAMSVIIGYVSRGGGGGAMLCHLACSLGPARAGTQVEWGWTGRCVHGWWRYRVMNPPAGERGVREMENRTGSHGV